VRAYLLPSGDGFPIFPWGSYLAFGVALGSMIPLVEKGMWGRVMQWSALAGLSLILGGRYFADLPYTLYSKSDFWLNSPALVACKMGVAFLLGSFAYVWMEYLNTGWSWIRQLGTTSLIVYWVHVDLDYGPWFASYRQKLGVTGCIVASLVMIPAMIGISVAFTRIRAHYKRGPVAVPMPSTEVEELSPQRLRA
jgi:fucose 4-O-acetylase-like acetyltransferase